MLQKYTGITTKIYKKQNPLLEDWEDLVVLAVKLPGEKKAAGSKREKHARKRAEKQNELQK